MKELIEKSPKELVEMRRTLSKELYSLKMKNAIRWLKETHKIWQTKTKVARLNTVLSAKGKEKNGGNRK